MDRRATARNGSLTPSPTATPKSRYWRGEAAKLLAPSYTPPHSISSASTPALPGLKAKTPLPLNASARRSSKFSWQLADLPTLSRRRQIRPRANVGLRLAHPLAQRLWMHAEVASDLGDRSAALDPPGQRKPGVRPLTRAGNCRHVATGSTKPRCCDRWRTAPDLGHLETILGSPVQVKSAGTRNQRRRFTPRVRGGSLRETRRGRGTRLAGR